MLNGEGKIAGRSLLLLFFPSSLIINLFLPLFFSLFFLTEVASSISEFSQEIENRVNTEWKSSKQQERENERGRGDRKIPEGRHEECTLKVVMMWRISHVVVSRRSCLFSKSKHLEIPAENRLLVDHITLYSQRKCRGKRSAEPLQQKDQKFSFRRRVRNFFHSNFSQIEGVRSER